jgi:hypothetical protein
MMGMLVFVLLPMNTMLVVQCGSLTSYSFFGLASVNKKHVSRKPKVASSLLSVAHPRVNNKHEEKKHGGWNRAEGG